MPKFRVILSRSKPQVATVWIDAANEEKAGEDAMDLALDRFDSVVWHDDDDEEAHSVSVADCISADVSRETL
jgi:hypothetical protein